MTARRRIAQIIVLFLAAIALLSFVGLEIFNPDVSRGTRGLAMGRIAEQFPEGLKPLGVLVVDNYHEYRSNTVRWRFVYMAVLILAAASSAAAGVVIKLQSTLKEESRRSDVAAVLGAIGALLITVSAVGGFEQSWRANRVAASEMENLAYQMLAGPSQEDVIREIQNINRRRLAGVAQLQSNLVTTDSQ